MPFQKDKVRRIELCEGILERIVVTDKGLFS